MRGTTMACAVAAVTAATLAGCSTGNGGNPLASHSTTVEYYRVFDIKTDVPAPTVARAATDGINRNVKDAVVAAPAGVEATELPGHFKIADSSSSPPAKLSLGPPVAKGPSCDGAAWTAKATPRVRGTEDMNLVACLFPYKSGYHLDMYAVFTKPEGGIMQWPRRLTGAFLGTPEKFTESAMMDVVRAIREGTGANVSLVEAKPNLAGTPWLESGTRTAQANTGSSAGSSTASSTGSAAGGAPGAAKPSSVPQ